MEDVVFHELLPDGRLVPPIKALSADEGNYCSPFTEILAPGYRVGWLALPGAVDMEGFHREALGRGMATAHGDIFSPVHCSGLRLYPSCPADAETLRAPAARGTLACHLATPGVAHGPR